MAAGRPRILLVEDDEIKRVVAREVGVALDEAENGQAAVDLFLQGRSYDLVLMDKDMPVMDGHETTKQLRSLEVMTPIVALSGDDSPSDRHLFFHAGADDFHTKPLSKEVLLGILAKYGLD